MKIALDVMGGDNAPDINVDGAKRALQDFPLIEKIYLVGREETVRSSCDRWGLSGPRVEIVPAAEVVEMNESGLLAVRKKKNSSMSISVDLVKSGDADAVVSAGWRSMPASTMWRRAVSHAEKPVLASSPPGTERQPA